MRRARVLLAAALAVVLAGCTAPRPDVSFYGDRTAVAAAPVGWCPGSVATGFQNCSTTRGNVVTLRLGRGEPLLVEVPGDVADVPWQVYVEYTDASGATKNTSTLFSDGRYSQLVRPLDPKDQFTYAEVQALPVPAATATGVLYVPTRTWAVEIKPN